MLRWILLTGVLFATGCASTGMGQIFTAFPKPAGNEFYGGRPDTQLIEFEDWVLRIRPTTHKPARLLLLLHGFTGDENSMWVFASRLPQNSWLAAPRAPYPSPLGGFSWRNESHNPAQANISGRRWAMLTEYLPYSFRRPNMICGEALFGPGVAERLMRYLAEATPSAERAAFPELTDREREVLQLVAEGKATKEIASILNVSVKTVEFHKTRIMKELRLRTAAELTKYAIAAGLTSIH